MFVRSLTSNTTTRVSRNTSGGLAHGAATGPTISGDGRFVAYESTAADAVSDDTNGVADAFVFDRNSSTTSRISTDQLGQQLATGGTFPVVSANGAFVTFATESPITGLGVATQRQLYVRLTVPLNPGSLPAVSVGNATVAEGNTKIRQVRFTVTLSKPSAAPTSVSFATFPGTTTRGGDRQRLGRRGEHRDAHDAVRGDGAIPKPTAITVSYGTQATTAGAADYTGKSGSITIPANSASGVISIAVKSDTAAEASETFKVRLTAVSAGVSIQFGTGTATILDDD